MNLSKALIGWANGLDQKAWSKGSNGPKVNYFGYKLRKLINEIV